ncbi:MAG: aminotransferase class V-fold PLP-dependent enzyme [Phycisphaerales bacterium]|nr:aminotransferase class V-fold PLP-dependent enzyme [Phycisphaerales bacterium]
MTTNLLHTDFIYLDNAATSWPKPACVTEAMVDFLNNKAGNPGRGGHILARAAADTIEDARTKIAKLINAPCHTRVVLTHGCTDALNMAIHGVIRAAQRAGCEEKLRVVTTVLEHNAVLRTLHCYAADEKIELVLVDCNEDGCICPNVLTEALTPCTVLVCLTHASNAMGTIQPVKESIAAVRKVAPEALVLVDCAQTLGHISVDVQELGIDLLAIAGHKGIGGPTGTGALYLSCRAYPDSCKNETPRVFCERRGGTGSKAPGLEMPDVLPDALEAGTANAVGFAGLVAAIDALDPTAHEHEMMLTQQILDGLSTIDNVILYGMSGTEGRTPVVLFNVKSIPSRTIADRLDREFNIATRAGTHCAPLAHKLLGNHDDGGIRVSPGSATTSEDIERFLNAMRTIVSEACKVESSNS